MKNDTEEKKQRRNAILSGLRSIIQRTSDLEMDNLSFDLNFFELGFDSLMLVKFGEGINNNFGIELKMSQLYEGIDTIEKVINYLDQSLPQNRIEFIPASPVKEQPPLTAAKKKLDSELEMSIESPDAFTIENLDAAEDSEAAKALEKIMSRQIDAMSKLMFRQLDMLQKGLSDVVSRESLESLSGQKSLKSKTHISEMPKISEIGRRDDRSQAEKEKNIARKGGFRMMKFEDDDLSTKQRKYLNNFIESYTSRTKKSKEFAERIRPVLSDWINTLGFRKTIKEIIYPIVAPRSSGSKIYDVDGNEYIDIAMGYGVTYFGNRAPFILQAIEDQLKDGFELGPQSIIAGEAAELIRELTGVERVAFCNTGSEAVMFAIRIARLVTKRKKIVLFSGSYHGNHDVVLVEPGEAGQEGSTPVDPGSVQGMVDDVIVMDYGVTESLEAIQSQCHEIAAVLVEPVQSRRPGFQPKEFLHKLRKLTREKGITLIFDEIITGFRLHPGGAQAFFGVEADLITYGKILGGGLPIGAVAGKAMYLDVVDGGRWNFGDESYPGNEVIFFAGTFCKHPIAMAVAKAVLTYLKDQGPALQENLNKKTGNFANELNDFFKKENVAIRVMNCGSLFRFESFGRYHLMFQPLEMDLLFYLLMKKGVYTWEKRICFFSTAHTDEDIEYVIRAVKESVNELREGGFSIDASPVIKKTLDKISDEAQGKISPNTRQKTQTFPMASAQRRLYVLSKLEGEKSSYQMSTSMFIEGELDLHKLENAFSKLLQRHDILKTGFKMQDGELLQKVYDNVPFEICHQEASDDKVDDIIRVFTGKPFNLKNPPLFRACLLKLSPKNGLKKRYLLILDAHHLAIDGLSVNIFAREFCRLYEGMNLPDLHYKYRDFVSWQEEHFKTEELKKQETYWLKKFSDEIPALALPTDNPRTAVRTSEGGVIYSRLKETETRLLKDLCKRTGTTLNMVLLACFYTLLHRLTGQEDIVVGLPVSGRPPGKFENVMGMFANTLPTRNYPKRNQSFASFLKEVKDISLKDYINQEYPFENLIDKLNILRDTSRNALFDSTFVYEKADERVFMIKDLDFIPYDINRESSQFDLSLEVIEQKGELRLGMEFSSQLFHKETISRWSEYYKKIILRIIENIDQPLSGIDILSDEEKNKLLFEFNDTSRDYPLQKSLPELFEEQVARTPDDPAVFYKEKSLSFRELNERANQLSHYLSSFKIGRNTMVGLCVEPSLETIVGILAILKAGAAYIPIDPYLPEERMAFLFSDSGISVLLTLKKFVSRLQEVQDANPDIPNTPNIKSISIVTIDLNGDRDEDEDGNWKEISRQSKKNPDNSVTGKDLAYAIYTSGSTGKPKGVLLEQRSISNFIFGLNEIVYSRYGKGLKLALISPIIFDASIQQVFGGLLLGNCIYMAPDEVRMDGSLILEFYKKYKIDISDGTPSHISMILEGTNGSPIEAGVKHFIIGGEVFSLSVAKRFLNSFKSSAPTILNVYGPTESCVNSTSFEISASGINNLNNIPIGVPMPNERIYILDEDNNLQPIGVPGELCICGDGVAKGYLKREKLTSEKFHENPFDKGDRMYRTGDFARWLPDGKIEFIQRLDRQVKVRGFRIELGEIDAAMAQFPETREVLTITGEDPKGDKRIVSYIIPENGNPFEIAEMRNFLREKLPEFMIPSIFITLDKFPRLPNGKVDTKSLPNPNETDIEKTVSYLAPRNKQEERLVRIWEEILGVGKIGIEDNFFELGGHSIKGMMMVSRIQKELNKKIALRDVFRFPTIASLTPLITTLITTGAHDAFSEIKPIPDQDYYDASNAQKRLWLFDQMGTNKTAYNMHVAYSIEGDLNIEAFQKTMSAVVARHESLRTVFIAIGGKPKQKIINDMQFKVEVIDISHETNPEASARELYLKEADRPFNLEKGPLIRVKLLKLAVKESNDQKVKYILIINIHHIIFDGWTFNVLSNEISTFYKDYKMGLKPQIPPLKIQYRDYTSWMNELLNNGSIQADRDYWHKKFSGDMPSLNFPLDYPRPKVRSFRGALEKFELNEILSARLKKLSINQGMTLFMTLLGAVNVCLYSYTSSKEIIIGIPVAGRGHPDLENQVGFFVNMLPLRNIFEPEDTFRAVLEKTKKTTMEAYQHEIYPFDKLVDELDLQRDSSRNHLFDVIVNLAKIEKSTIDIDGVSVGNFMEESITNRADLQFMFEDNGQLKLVLEYDTDLFKKETAKKICNNTLLILKAFTENINYPLKEVGNLLLTRVEKEEQEKFFQSAMEIGEEF